MICYIFYVLKLLCTNLSIRRRFYFYYPLYFIDLFSKTLNLNILHSTYPEVRGQSLKNVPERFIVGYFL